MQLHGRKVGLFEKFECRKATINMQQRINHLAIKQLLGTGYIQMFFATINNSLAFAAP